MDILMTSILVIISQCMLLFSPSAMSDFLWPHGLQHTRLLCPSLFPMSLLKFMSIESVMLSNHLMFFHSFPFYLQSLPASQSFPMSQLFTSGSQNIGASALASVLPMNLQSLFPLGLTGLISLQSEGLSRVFSSTTIWRHQLWCSVFFMEESACNVRDLGSIPGRREWLPIPVFLPGEFHGQWAWQATVHGVEKSQTWLNK